MEVKSNLNHTKLSDQVEPVFLLVLPDKFPKNMTAECCSPESVRFTTRCSMLFTRRWETKNFVLMAVLIFFGQASRLRRLDGEKIFLNVEANGCHVFFCFLSHIELLLLSGDEMLDEKLTITRKAWGWISCCFCGIKFRHSW